MARVLLGVTGGIAAYKACTLVRLLVRAGYEVEPVLTSGAERFVARETFTALARRTPSADPYPHLARFDLLVVAPLTANTLARMAHGLADDVLTEAVLAHDGPVLVAPAMNTRMWLHPATQENVATLRERGVELVGPAEGELAEGEEGIGRMAEPEEIFERIQALIASSRKIGASPARSSDRRIPEGARFAVADVQSESLLAGKHVLISAGGTREPLDSVRYVGNRSSGRMGVALAEEARARGAEVTLLAANLAVAAPAGVRVVEVPTAADLEREALARADADVVVMAAAVADYRAVAPSETKRPKDGAGWQVELEPTTDVLAALGATRRPGQVLVGFAADEGDAGLERARAKRKTKNADLFVFNDVSRADIGFDVGDNEVVVLSANGDRAVEKAPKRAVAAAVLDEVERLLSAP